MCNAAKYSILLAMGMMLVAPVWAADETKSDEEQGLNNPKEPALQVVRTTGRGLHALVHHSMTSLKEGNEHFPILGSVMLLEGFGKGLVELATSTYKGMAGSKPKPYDELSKANLIIDDDPVLRNSRQVAGTAVAAGAGGVAAVGGLYAGQKAVKQVPRQEVKTERPRKEEPEKKRMSVYDAQRRYVKDRVDVGRQTERGRGNLLKQLRRRD